MNQSWGKVMISLEQAKKLVELLEKGEQEAANELYSATLIESIHNIDSSENNTVSPQIIERIGQLTRMLHDSLKDIHFDKRMSQLTVVDMPDARSSLSHVVDKTERAANRTMDAVECCMPIVDELRSQISKIEPSWSALMKGDLPLHEFKSMCHSVHETMIFYDESQQQLRNQLNDILMAQDYQDLTGQIIQRVIGLVEEVEQKLIAILKDFNVTEHDDNTHDVFGEPQHVLDTKAEGPMTHKEATNNRLDDQDDVDDLLESLGF